MSYGRDDFESKTASSGRRGGFWPARGRPSPLSAAAAGPAGSSPGPAPNRPSVAATAPQSAAEPHVNFLRPARLRAVRGRSATQCWRRGTGVGTWIFTVPETDAAAARRGPCEGQAASCSVRRRRRYDPLGQARFLDPFGAGDGYDKDDFYRNGSLNRVGDSFDEPAERGLETRDSGGGMGIGRHSTA